MGREELIDRLWADESHGDFDHRLNKVINKLRFILGDDPSCPRYIKTLPRRGYCFVAEIRIIETAVEALPVSQPTPEIAFSEPGESVPPSVPLGELEQPQGRPLWLPWRSWDAAMIAALAICVLAGFGYGIRNVVANVKVRRSVAVIGFRNLTGKPEDAWLSAALSDWLTTDLSAGGEVRVIPREKVAEAQSELGLVTGDSFSRETLGAIRQDLGIDLVLAGAFATVAGPSGDTLRLDVRVQDTRTGKVLRSFTQVGARSEALQLASKAGLSLRSELGLGPFSPQGLRLVRASLPVNPDAARLYAEGVAALQKYNAVEASALLLQASSIEPNHVPTHAALAAAWSALGYDTRAREEAQIAFRDSKDLPREQQLAMEGLLRETNKNWNAAADVHAELFRLYPDDIDYGLKLANAQILAGKAVLAMGTIQAMREMTEPLSHDPRIDLTEAHAAAAISDFRLQQQAATRAESKGRKVGLKLLVANAELEEGSALRSLGNLPQALQLWHQARETFAAAGDRRGVAKSLNDEGVLLWQKGDGPGATKAFQESITLSRATGDQATLAFAMSRLGIVDMYSGTRDLVEVRRLFQEALEIYRHVENVQEQGYIVSLIADEMLGHDQWAEAKKTYEESLALSRAVNDRSRIAGRLMDIGIVDTVQGDLEGATDSLEKSLSIYRELGEKNRVVLVQNRLAMAMLWQGKTSQAASTIESSLAIAREVGEADVVAQMYEGLAYIQMEENPERAASSAMASMERHKASGERHGVAQDSVILAQALLLDGKIAKSKVSLNQAFQIQILGPKLHGEPLIQMWVVSGQLHAREGQLKAARMDLTRATTLARSLGADSMGMEARLAMAELELQSGDKNARRDLDALLREASRRGFGLITARAAKKLHTSVQAGA